MKFAKKKKKKEKCLDMRLTIVCAKFDNWHLMTSFYEDSAISC